MRAWAAVVLVGAGARRRSLATTGACVGLGAPRRVAGVQLISGATRLLAAVFCAGLVIAAPASAQSPPDGSAFTTTDTVHFEHPEAAGGDRAYVFSLTPDRSDGWFTLGHERDETVDLGWLATKFEHLGAFYWSACTTSVDSNGYETLGECSAPLSFSVRFRFATLTRAAARGRTRSVMRRQFRDYWVSGYNRKVTCRRRSRIRQRCKVAVAVGDVLLRGTVTIYPKRERTWEVPYYRATIQIYNEYCHVVDHRPLSECLTKRRRSGRV